MAKTVKQKPVVKKAKSVRPKPLRKKELVTLMMDKTDFSKQDTLLFLDSFNELIQEELKTKKIFLVQDIGRIILVDKPERMARNPRTGEQVKVPPKTVLKFRFAKQLKTALGLVKTESKNKGKVSKKKTDKAKTTSKKKK